MELDNRNENPKRKEMGAMDARITLLSSGRSGRDLLETELVRCLERREDAFAAGRIDLVRFFERRLATTDYMLGGVA